MRWALVVALLATACSRRVSERDDSLQDYLGTLAGAGETARRSAVERWKLDPDGWDRVTTDPYRAHYKGYALQFDERIATLAVQLAKPGAITIRPHFAGDPKLTIGQARARWAQPVAASSQVAELDGVPIDAVFVRDGERWRAIVGVDTLIFNRMAAKDLACATRASGQLKGTCGDLAWFIADATLRDDGPRLERACTQLANLCPRNP
jgi:hypothetical protein